MMEGLHSLEEGRAVRQFYGVPFFLGVVGAGCIQNGSR